MPDNDVIKYFVFASIVPPEGKGEFGWNVEVEKSQVELVQKQIIEKKDRIVFEKKDNPGHKICFNNQWPVVYVTTKEQRIPLNLYVPDQKEVQSINNKKN